jgi:hypothetical protein
MSEATKRDLKDVEGLGDDEKAAGAGDGAMASRSPCKRTKLDETVPSRELDADTQQHSERSSALAVVSPERPSKDKNDTGRNSDDASSEYRPLSDASAFEHNQAAKERSGDDLKPEAKATKDIAVAESNNEDCEIDSDNYQLEAVVDDGNTVITFGMHSGQSYRDILITAPQYVDWARKVKDPSGDLLRFVEWTRTEGARAIQCELGGKEEFGFGQHVGQTFETVARVDPGYDLRYEFMKPRARSRPAAINRYIKWFELDPIRILRSQVHHQQHGGCDLCPFC